MAEINRRLLLAQRPSGEVTDADVTMETGPVPEPGDGEALLHNRFISIDPTIRTWMDDSPGYLPPIAIGAVVRAGAVAEVVASNNERYKPGDLVFGMTGWQDYALIGGDSGGGGGGGAQILPAGIDPHAALSVFGTTGMTAYFGLTDVGRPEEGETVVVSGAAGATGSIVGQIARVKGAKNVVGLAGSDDKCRWLTDELGFDAAINYKTENVAKRLHETCPDGIDIYFDNVGGEILNVALAQLAMRGRVVLCGAIASYNDASSRLGPANYVNLIRVRGRMEGFLILDYLDRFPHAQAEMAGWVAAGRVKFSTHVVRGLERAPEALNMLFTGANTGKVIVEVE